jgi:hypothetical protein
MVMTPNILLSPGDGGFDNNEFNEATRVVQLLIDEHKRIFADVATGKIDVSEWRACLTLTSYNNSIVTYAC